jgi:AcrR family transcriptional regulator
MPRKARRAQLLDAALEVFVANGYHSAAMDDIAERAGVSKPVLYQHFPSKLDLYLALLDQTCDTVIDAVREALQGSPDNNKQRVQATMDVFYAYVANAGGAFRLVFESDLVNEPAVRERVDRVTTESAESIAEVIHDDTGLPAEESELLAVSLVGMAHVSARFWLAKERHIPQDDAADLVAGLAWRGIRGFPRHEEPSA